MRDLDALVRDTFRAYAGRAPATVGLAERVVSGVRRRRRRQALTGVAVAAALLIPVAWFVSPATQPGGPTAGVAVADLPELRWESYGGIVVQVPTDWGYGDLTQWCAPDDMPGQVDGPSVDRPGAGRTVVCSANDSTGTRGLERPTYTAGLLLRSAGLGPRLGRADVAPEAAVYRRRVGQVELTVVDVAKPLADHILSSAVVMPGADLNGCETNTTIPRMGRYLRVPGGSVPAASEIESASVCHYERFPWQRPTVVFSERLSGNQAQSLRAALDEVSPTDAYTPVDVAPRCVETEAALVRLWSDGRPTDLWVHYAGCGPYGIDDGVQPRELSVDILRPVLDPPWRGSVADPVPWPPQPWQRRS